jgi:hypothetical protein
MGKQHIKHMDELPKFPELPTLPDGFADVILKIRTLMVDYHIARVRYWEARCRLAVEALQMIGGLGAITTLEKIGSLPEREP